MITLKSLPNLYAPPSPINMTTMIIQSSLLLLDPPGKLDHQTIHCPTANFGPLSRGNVNNPMLITVFDPKVTRSLGLSKDPSNSACSALTHFYFSLAHEHVNLEELYNQNIKEMVTAKVFLKKKTGFTGNPHPHRHSVQKVFFKLNPLFVMLAFQIIYQ